MEEPTEEPQEEQKSDLEEAILARKEAHKREARLILTERIHNRAGVLLGEVRDELLQRIHHSLEEKVQTQTLNDLPQVTLDPGFTSRIDGNVELQVNELLTKLKSEFASEPDAGPLLPSAEKFTSELKSYRDQILRTNLLQQIEVFALPTLSKAFPEGLAFVSLILARSLPLLFLNLYTSVQGTTALFATQFVVAALLMLPSTMILGATLPIAVLALPSTAADVGQQVARLYAWNLLGSALGAIGASVLLLASLGLEFSVRVAALGAIGTALILVYKIPKFSMVTSAISASIALVILALDPAGERALKTFGIYSDVRTYSRFEPNELRSLLAAHQLLYYRDGPTATVAVQQIDRFRLLKINGKTDASNGPGDTQTQRLMGHLPFVAADPRRLAVVGWGTGMTVAAVLTHPVSSVRAFEIEPAVVEASRFFDEETGNPLADERVELIMGDARNLLRREDETYDLIINEPSNPWLTGVSNLFTEDFFQIMADRLTPDGVVCQWIHLYGMTEESTRSLVGTFREVFPHVMIFKDRDLIMLGSRQPLKLSMRRLQAFFDEPGIRESLEEAAIQYPADILVTLRLDEDGAYAFSEGAPLNTDDNMRIELAAPKSLYQDRIDAILADMSKYSASIFKHLVDFDSRAGVEIEIAASLFTTGRKKLALDHALRAVEMSPSFESQKLLGQVLESLG